MRLLPVLLISIATSVAAAQYTYILPIHGSAAGFRSQSFALPSVVNPNTTTATLRFEAAYPVRPVTSRCALPDPIVLRPHQVRNDVPQACPGTLHALLMVSDQPVEVIDDVGLFLSQSFTTPIIEHIDVANDWLPADKDVLIPMVRMVETALSRGNLFIVNPNDFVLVVSVQVERPEAGSFFTQTFAVAVEPQSLNRTSLPVIPYLPHGPSPYVSDGIHHVTLRANGKFQAGISAITQDVPVWRAPIPLQP